MGRTETDGGNSARESGRLFQHDMGALAGKAQFGSRSAGRMERPPSVRWKAAFCSSSAGITRRANCSTYGSCPAGTAGMLTCPPCFACPLNVGAEGDLILPVASYQKNGFSLLQQVSSTGGRVHSAREAEFVKKRLAGQTGVTALTEWRNWGLCWFARGKILQPHSRTLVPWQAEIGADS